MTSLRVTDLRESISAVNVSTEIASTPSGLIDVRYSFLWFEDSEFWNSWIAAETGSVGLDGAMTEHETYYHVMYRGDASHSTFAPFMGQRTTRCQCKI